MNYDEACSYIINEINRGDNGIKLLMLIAEDDKDNGIKLIRKLTKCYPNDAELLWSEVKSQYGDSETNPLILSPEEIARNNAAAREWMNQPKCPTCSSTNVQKIGDLERISSVAMLGAFSNKINKSFKCKNCGYTW